MYILHQVITKLILQDIELQQYPIFQYLRDNRIEDNKDNDYYLGIMLYLKDSMIQFGQNFYAGMEIKRARELIAAFYSVIDYIAAESSRRYYHINVPKFNEFTKFVVKYTNTKNLVNGQYAYKVYHDNELQQMYDEFQHIITL